MKLRFSDCELDVAAMVFRRGGEEIHVEPQVFDLLRLLAEADGALVTRDQIVEAVWNGRIVSEATISSRINAARRAVGDTGASQSVIVTVPRRGLKLAAPIRAPEVPAQDAAPPAPAVQLVQSPDGATIAWTAEGKGPVLVRAGHWLSHLQLDRSSPVWAPLLERLGRGRRLVRYDQRGTGLSGRSVTEFTVEALSGDLEAVVDACGDTPIAIFAASQACGPAIAYAARRPERVSRMILCGGFVQGPLRRGSLSGAMAEGVMEMTRAGWGRGGSPFMKSVAALFMPGAGPEQLEDFIKIQLASADPETAVALRRAIGEMDVTDSLAQVQCPVLVAHAEGDALHPIEQGRTLAALIPGAEFLPLPGDNHVCLPQTDAFHILMDAVDAFLLGA